jgi:D-arginine dehydrogenase
VVVLEAESQPAYHSSGRSAAMYIEGYENHVVRELTKAGREFFFSPPAGFADNVLVTPCGGLTAAGPGEGDGLQKYLDAWQPLCPELVSISPQETLDIVPILRKAWVSGAAFDPSWHKIDVHELLTGYQRGLRQHDGELVTGAEVSSLEQTPDGWMITAGTQTISAGLVINAAGAWANQVAALAGLAPIPLTPMRRTAAIVAAPEGAEHWPLVHTIGEDLYFKPESPGLMVCPQDETPSEAMDAFPVDLDIAIALDRFQQVAEHNVERVMHQWAGLRTFAPDRYPAVGYADAAKGFFWLAGQGGFGVQTSPGLGKHAADVVLGREQPLAKINVSRFVT